MRQIRLLSLLAVAAFAGMTMAQPKVAFHSMESQGVYLMPVAGPDAGGILDPRRDPAGNALMKYAAVLDNRSSRDLAGFSVHWRCVNAAGKTVRHVLMRYDYETARAFPAGSRVLVSMVSGLNQPGVELFPNVLERFRKIYERQTTIDVELDAVIFADGGTAGPDTDKWIPRVRAAIDAERDLFRAAVNAPDVYGYPQAVVDSAVELLPPGGDRSPGRLFMEANNERSYVRCYELMKGANAFQLISAIDRNGTGATLRSTKGALAYRRYLDIRG